MATIQGKDEQIGLEPNPQWLDSFVFHAPIYRADFEAVISGMTTGEVRRVVLRQGLNGPIRGNGIVRKTEDGFEIEGRCRAVSDEEMESFTPGSFQIATQ